MNKFKAVLVAVSMLALVGCSSMNMSPKLEYAKGAVVLIMNKGETAEQSTVGTGYFIAENVIVTNYHVVRDAKLLEVTLQESNREYEGVLIAGDELADVAIIELTNWNAFLHDGNKPHYLKFAPQKTVVQGEAVWAIGHPWGLTWSVTKGIVSSPLRRSFNGHPTYFIQTDTKIVQGNSGGPLLDESGNVIGMNSQMWIRGEGGSYGMAIPANQIQKTIKDLEVYKEVRWASMGFSLNNGARVIAVDPLKPAERAGLKVNDIIISVTNETGTVRGNNADRVVFGIVSSDYKAPLFITVQRGEKTLTLTATPGYRTTAQYIAEDEAEEKLKQEELQKEEFKKFKKFFGLPDEMPMPEPPAEPTP